MFEFGDEVAVKVCGITNVGDAMTCAALGVQMIGLNFSPQSLRRISPASAAEIITAVRAEFRGSKFVGVFVNQNFDSVEAIATDLALDGVQLHGDETREYVRDLKAPFVIKALRVGPQFITSSAARYRCDAILLDAWSASAPGGTGKTFPWEMAADARLLVKRLFLAGGLTPDNVGDALRVVRPFALDVCSGVEDVPGRKNRAKLRRFIEAARATNEVEP